jgi:hypothetical protein
MVFSARGRECRGVRHKCRTKGIALKQAYAAGRCAATTATCKPPMFRASQWQRFAAGVLAGWVEPISGF